ncbi:hypothetical protein K2173_004553 [Erythroxylum novogranatense]|uniref:Myb-like domain-containing protein n=1 Tax=Erythroxylum novogranatense TaxID=1862640 RepID=A0AAV8T5B1_9ROSI|nr:hypothetical protein K2173_004553 [Erythroxylum novogranatense]
MADFNNHTSDNSTSKCTKVVKNEDTKCLDFTEDEETLIARMFSLVGARYCWFYFLLVFKFSLQLQLRSIYVSRWSLIAGRIPGRSAEQIEKYWTSKFCSSSSNE